MQFSANVFFMKFIFKYLFYGYFISIFVLFFYSSISYILFYVIFGLLISYIVKLTLKYSNHIYTSVMSIYIYIGYLLQFPIIIINQESYAYGTLNSLGEFDFSIYSFMYIYSFIILFLIINLIFGILFETRKKLLILKDYYYKKVRFNKYNITILGIVFFQIFINIFMFYHKVGIPGLVPESLPFKLSGFLYYYRFFIYPFLLIYFIYKGNIKSRFIIFLIIIEMLEASFLSSSKAIVLLHSFPIYYILFREGKIRLIIMLFLIDLLLFPFVALVRNIYYQMDNLNLTIFFQAIDCITNYDFDQNIIGSAIALFVNRMVGLKEFIMTSFSPCKYTDIMYYFDNHLKLTNLAAPLNIDCMYGFQISKINDNGFAFGYALDLLSKIKLSSNGYFIFILVSSLHTVIFIYMEKIYINSLKFVIKNNTLLVLFVVFLIFITITSFYLVKYILYFLIVFFVIKSFLSKKRRLYNENLKS